MLTPANILFCLEFKQTRSHLNPPRVLIRMLFVVFLLAAWNNFCHISTFFLASISFLASGALDLE